MNELGNTLEDLLTADQLKEYLSLEYPFNTNFLGNVLKEKLKEDPDYEVWAPLFYCRYMLRRKDPNSPSIIRSPLTLISNKGKLAKYTGGRYVTISSKLLKHGYFQTMLNTDEGVWVSCILHRALASVFVPLPPELKMWHPKDLQVNHIDGVKSNFGLSNLEWTTDSGNKTHAVETGLIKSGKDSIHTKPVKGRIEFGLYVGHEFILYGLSDYKKYRFTQQNINACCRGIVRSHKNCSWSYATESELKLLPHGLTEVIRKSLDEFRKSMSK